MKKLSSILAIMLTIVMASSGCSKKSDALEQSAPTEAKPITIQFWHSMTSGANAEATKAIVQKFNETNKFKITVEETAQGAYNDCSAKIMQAVAAKTNPEVAMLDRALIPQYEPLGALEDMMPYAKKDNFDYKDFVDGLMVFSLVNNKLVSLPFNRSTPVLYYNKDAFKEAGLDPEKAPSTWDELFDYAKKLTKVTNGETTRYGFSMVIDTGWFLTAMVGQQGGVMIDESGDKVMFTEDGRGLNALKFWKKLADSGYYRIPATTDPGTAMMQDFYQGKLAMMYQSTGNMSGILKNTEDAGSFKVGTAFLAKKDKYYCPTGGANLVMLSNVSKEQKAAAWEFLKFATSTENSAEFSVKTGYVPTRKSSVDSDVIKNLWKQHPQYQVAYKQLEYASDSTKSQYFWEYNSMTNKIVSSLIQDGSITTEEAIKQLKSEAALLFPGNKK